MQGRGGGTVPHIEFFSTIEADLVRPLPDCEHATQVLVMAPKDELEYPKHRVHGYSDRLRSQLPLVSSHSSKERTLARARAMEQSAAP